MDNCSNYTVDEYFSQRLSLCVLDTIRLLQNHRNFENGVNICHVIEAIRNRCFIDGDIKSQIMSAIKDLESVGFIMTGPNGVRTLGPFAKLSLAKTQKQKHLTWKKIEANLLIEKQKNDQRDLIFEARKCRRYFNEENPFTQIDTLPK